MNQFIRLTLIVALFTVVCLGQSVPPMLVRKPTISQTHIAFSYAGDLWTVPRTGGEATRLTVGTGTETDPHFSPDGTQIAFTGEYDGNIDVFVIPTAGGEPKRITYHPGADRVEGWTNDGKQILFSSGRSSESARNAQLFTVAADGGFPAALPLPMAYEAAYSPDNTRLAYVPLSRAFDAWKRYRGGRTTPIWIANLADSSIERIPRDNSNDFDPMWVNNKVYFLSDRSGPITLFSFDPATKKVTEEIKNTGLDIKAAAATRDAIVYEQFGSIHVFDLKSAKSSPVQISINTDLPSVRPHYVKVANRIAKGTISPTGARAVFAARGEIISVPVEKGNARNLTNSAGIAERDPAWSPDGKWIAYFSDESGEYALHLRNQNGMGEIKKIALAPSFYYNPVWSPDSKKIAFTDKQLILWYVDIEKGSPVKVDTTEADRSTFSPAWSPDSRWIAYSKMLKSWTRAIFAYGIETAKSVQITDGLSDARNPVFDKNGKYLYFLASTDFGPTQAGLDMSSYPLRSTRNVYLAVLKRTEASPLAPESDEEKVVESSAGENKKPEANATAPANGAPPQTRPTDAKTPPKVEIETENIAQRILALPVPAKNFFSLQQGKANTLFIFEMGVSGSNTPGNLSAPGATVHKFDLEKRKLDRVLDGVFSFDVSANGEKFLYQQGPNWFIVNAAAPVRPGDGRLRTDEMETLVDPRAEWEQMYREVWRLERDFFYAPNYHGLDLKEAEKKYEPYLKAVAHRSELNYLFNEMLGELTVGHLYVQGGDIPTPNRVAGGLLGCDYRIENGRYRFARIYNGENWNPTTRAPLTQPGVNVAEGEYIISVRGRNITANDNIYAAFENTAGKAVVMTVGPNPDGSGARQITVVPVESEANLRYLAWIENNRRKVDQMSKGKLAYVHLPDTAAGGYSNFNRYYFAQLDKEGAVIDERFNGGGSAADYIVERLGKKVMSYWAVREGMEATTPFGVLNGPKVMIANEFAGSGGDFLPWAFQRNKIGPVVGKRTWGGLVGIGGYPPLIDGGSVTAPHFAFYSPESKWEVENNGVAPDVEVELDPKAWRAGKDLQLEKAVDLALSALEKSPVKRVSRPEYPNYHAPKSPKSTVTKKR